MTVFSITTLCAKKNCEPKVWIVGETKHNLSTKNKFIKQVERARQQVVKFSPFAIAHCPKCNR
ncbi:MAG: hypothetical protein DRR08_23585 [Candidatus Parabeggiatoa sp. nov. 2]|nr:MAG: hypothetical protein B6247_19590 [Beggiatoa sp. 4572_84]RKZ55712.1 MAG: hypothetical protein DRR08_23585 [Gammaproteobacteria bacterium]